MDAHDVKFALIGCGRVSGKHVDAIASTPGAKLVAVCDIDVARARAVGDKLGVPWFSDIDELIARGPDIDVASILTPTGYHPQHTIRLARHGKHILVEKPMALRIEDGEEMIRACDRAGVQLFVVKQNRFNPPVIRLREAVEAGRFGKIVMGTARVRWCRRQEYYDQDAWRGTWELDGGVLANQASHYVDLLIWMLGRVESVVAMTARRLVNIEAEDTAAALLRFESGAVGIIEATTATRPIDLEGSLSILGERGAVVIGGFAVNELATWNFDRREPGDPDPEARASKSNSVYGLGHRAVIENVVATIRAAAVPSVDGREGLRSIEVIDAIYRAAQSGREVKLTSRDRQSSTA